MSTGVSKIVAERNHRILLELALKPGNDICADCKVRAPRWASHNLGIFICVNCASIHRKIGTHVTKVKSITLDEWTKEQVEVMKEKGNTKSNALYNPNEARHPPPTNMVDSERDSELEKFIRSKYEFRRFMDRTSGSASLHLLADPRAASARSRPPPLIDAPQSSRRTSPGPPPPPKTPENMPPGLRHSATMSLLPHNPPPPTRSASQPLPSLTGSEKLSAVPPLRRPGAIQSSIQKPAGQVWSDLVSLQEPSQSSSLPLQFSPATSIVPAFSSQLQVPVHQQPATPGSAMNPFTNLALGQAHPMVPFVPSPVSTPGAQFSFVPSAPISSPALHIGAANPFNQAFSSASANATGIFPTNPNPFSPSPMPVSMTMSTPTTPSVHAIMTGNPLPTQTLGYIPSQMSTPTSTLPFPSTPFGPAATMSGLAQNSFTPAGAVGQMPLSANVATNPFSTQVGQAGYFGTSPQTGAVLNQQHHQQLGSSHGFNVWPGQGAQQGTF